jgi:serine/threonine-protein kinase TNNI3K
MVVGICKALAYVHAMNGMHRDLKPANVLLDANYEVRLADFRSAKFADPEATIRNTAKLGAPLYMAPEVVDGEYDERCDVFSFAMVLWEIATGKPLAQLYQRELDQNPFGLVEAIARGKRPPLDALGPEVSGIVECCWDGDPESRIPFADILVHLQQNSYSILGRVDQAQIAEYLARINLYEEEYPAEPPESD